MLDIIQCGRAQSRNVGWRSGVEVGSKWGREEGSKKLSGLLPVGGQLPLRNIIFFKTTQKTKQYEIGAI